MQFARDEVDEVVGKGGSSSSTDRKEYGQDDTSPDASSNGVDKPDADTGTASVSTTGLADSPSGTDQIGFAPYVRALARFLASAKTAPPMTVSIEGKWGSGKSSLMIQLAAAIRNPIPGVDPEPASANRKYDRSRYCVWFNAWRSDKDEALWASFALSLIGQLGTQIGWRRRVSANWRLAWQRLDLDGAKWEVARGFLYVVAFLSLFVFVWTHPEHLGLSKAAAPQVAAPLSLVAAAAAFPWVADKLKRVFGNPLARDLKRYLHTPDYATKVSFVERFQEDFSRILRSYVKSARVYVLIDDLDRCEVPKAADLMQAINLLLSADQPTPNANGELDKPPANLFFILGIDRELVAASIAAKHEKVLPFLLASRHPNEPASVPVSQFGMLLGYEYLEKFIQVTFRVPRLESGNVAAWVNRPTEDSISNQVPLESQADMPRQLIKDLAYGPGGDPTGFNEAITEIAQILQFTPRRLKQFVNVFRLQVLVGVETGSLTASVSPSESSTPPYGVLTLARMGVVISLFVCWPELLRDLLSEPELLSYISSHTEEKWETRPPTPTEQRWLQVVPLTTLLHRFPMDGVNIRPILELVPGGSRPPTRWQARGNQRYSFASVGNGDSFPTGTPSPPTPIQASPGPTGPSSAAS